MLKDNGQRLAEAMSFASAARVLKYRKSLKDFLMPFKLLGFIKENQVGIVCCFGLLSGYFGLIAGRLAGLPVVATDCYGNRETIIDGATGFLVRNEPEDIAERLFSLLEDSYSACMIGEAGRQTALRANTGETLSQPQLEKNGGEAYLKSYRDMVEARRELCRYLGWYNIERKHSYLGDRSPDAIYSSRETGNHEAA